MRPLLDLSILILLIAMLHVAIWGLWKLMCLIAP